MSQVSRLLIFIALSIILIPCGHAAAYSRSPDTNCLPNFSTYPAMAGFSMGMAKFESSYTALPPISVTFDWGDDATSTALLACTTNPATTLGDPVYAIPQEERL